MTVTARIQQVLKRKPDAGPDEAAENRRWAQRKPRSLPAYLLSERLQGAVQCVVRDMSSTGAKLQLAAGATVKAADDVPETFTLYLLTDEIEVDCAVAWRRASSLGVRFTSTTRPRPRPRVVRRRK